MCDFDRTMSVRFVTHRDEMSMAISMGNMSVRASRTFRMMNTDVATISANLLIKQLRREGVYTADCQAKRENGLHRAGYVSVAYHVPWPKESAAINRLQER